MGSDENVGLPRFRVLEDLSLLAAVAKAADHPDGDGKRLEALAKGVVVLQRQDGRGGQDGNLLAVVDGPESGSHSHFGLSVPHVSTDQAIHGTRRHHVLLDGLDGGSLVGGCLIRERRLELPDQGVVLREDMPPGHLPLCVQLE